jgi:hypothetical protein
VTVSLGHDWAMSTAMSPDQRTVRRLVGVYNANGTVLGELRYFVGARFGRSHCPLCDITHGLVRPKPEWIERRERLPVAFDTYHRDDQPDALRRRYDAPPIIAAETDAAYILLVGPEELTACHGSTEQLTAAIERAVTRTQLQWPT